MTSSLPLAKTLAPAFADSWTSLLASTMGLAEFGRIRLSLSGEPVGAGVTRVFVQVYEPGALGLDGLPRLGSKVLGAMERTVDTQEISRGLDLSLLHDGTIWDGCEVLAWLDTEAGDDAEFGGLGARPTHALERARARVVGNRATIRFDAAREFGGLQAA